MLPFAFFEKALPYDRFLTEHGSPAHKARWDRVRDSISLTAEQRKLLGSFARQTNVLLLAGAWCGDCAAQCPAFERFAEAAPVVAVRYLDRDAHPAAQAELKVNGGDRVPVAVFFSEDGHEVARYGERTLTAYRRMMAEVSGETCGSGVVAPGDGHLAGVVADWLRELERVQYLLRLSPRLRRLHGD